MVSYVIKCTDNSDKKGNPAVMHFLSVKIDKTEFLIV